MSLHLNKSSVKVMRDSHKWCPLCEKGLERTKLQKIKSISQRSGWMVFFTEILSEIDLYCENSRTPDTWNKSLIKSQIVLLAILVPSFSPLACFPTFKCKRIFLPTQEPVNTMLERKMCWFNSQARCKMVRTCNLTSFCASISLAVKWDSCYQHPHLTVLIWGSNKIKR